MAACATLLALVPSARSQTAPAKLFHAVHAAMGSEFVIDLYAPDEETAGQWMQLSFDEIDRIEALLSNYRTSSELSRISREAGQHQVTTDPETFAFLQTSLRWSRLSHGAFDITVGPLMRSWGFFFNNGRIPSEGELARTRAHTGWEKVLLDEKTHSVSFAGHTSMELDPGGIGKGYAVDRIVLLLREQNVGAALISAGSSSIYAIGAPPDAAGWRINVPDPADPRARVTSVLLRDASLSSSSCAEKFFVRRGQRFCHILDPHTSRPIAGMLQTTVVAPSATDTDALSTATFVLGCRAGARLLASLPDTNGVLICGTMRKPHVETVRWKDPIATIAKPTKGSRSDE